MTEPLTPPDCDLRGLPFMPLDVIRLLDSDVFAKTTGDEFKAALALWCKSWTQVPAASLPDDDRVLAHLSGAGSKWRKVREMALSGWVKCADGRLYHSVVAEKALEALPHRQAHAEKKTAEAERKARERDDRKGLFALLRRHGQVPSYDTATRQLREMAARLQQPEGSEVTPKVTPPVTPVTRTVTAKTGTGTGTGTGTEKKEEVEGALVLPFVPADTSEGGQAARARGSRLKPDWKPSADNLAYAISQGFTGDEADRIAEAFRDYWIAVSGQKATKLDWSAAWRTWVRNERDRRTERGPQPRKQVDWI